MRVASLRSPTHNLSISCRSRFAFADARRRNDHVPRPGRKDQEGVDEEALRVLCRSNRGSCWELDLECGLLWRPEEESVVYRPIRWMLIATFGIHLRGITFRSSYFIFCLLGV